MKTFTCFADVCDGLMEIRARYNTRAEFYILEFSRLNIMLHSAQISESRYYQRLCPLLIEKRKINVQYKHEVSEFMQYVPQQFYIVDVLSYFDEDIL